jgi:hypothetical protein
MWDTIGGEDALGPSTLSNMSLWVDEKQLGMRNVDLGDCSCLVMPGALTMPASTKAESMHLNAIAIVTYYPAV